MTKKEKERFLKEIKQMIQFTNFGNWFIDICASDFDFRNECDSLEEYKESFNYLIGQLLRDEEI